MFEPTNEQRGGRWAMSRKIILQPVAMLKPNSQFNYEPSRIRPQKIVTEAEFLEKYADHPYEMLVSGVRTTAYSGWPFWYIVAGEMSE